MKIFGEPYDSVLFRGIGELNPMQKEVMKSGFIDGGSLVVAAPTSSGKTLIAEMAIVSNYLRGGKSIYLSPLRALASEKYNSFRRFSEFGMKVRISTGDFDSSDVGEFDLLVTTSEKLDSLFRHGSRGIEDASLLVVDEIHMINDYSRGPTLELNIMRFANKQIIGLSATIPNAWEIAEWIGAELVISDYRPVRLDIGILHNGVLDIGGRKHEVDDDIELIRDTVSMDKQIIVFVSSRRVAESYSLRVAGEIGIEFPESEKILVIDPPTPQCEMLEKALRGGVAFHHAGLHPRQREMVEKWFRERKIPVIVATPTLAMGLNMPAFRVMVRDLKRFSGGYSDFLPASEVHQMLGRAGRPGLDERGEGIIYAKNHSEYSYAVDYYLKAGAEKVFSKLSAEPVLRSHVLNFISEGMGSVDEIIEFLSSSFFAYQYKDMRNIEKSVARIIGDLISWGMVEDKEFGRISATPLGRRTSQLYLDPLSAYRIVMSEGSDEMGYLFSISTCGEMYPLLRPRKDDEFDVEMEARIPDELIFDFDASMKTAMFLRDWIEEKSEKYLFEKYGITPGGIYQKIRAAEWLLYSGKELFLIMKKYRESRVFEVLMNRVRHGVREELLPLVQIKGIGRKRARKLYDAGITSPTKYYRLSKEEIKKILGRK